MLFNYKILNKLFSLQNYRFLLLVTEVHTLQIVIILCTYLTNDK